MLWGTDWPHPNIKGHMPDDGQLVDFIPKIATTAEQQQQAAGRQPRPASTGSEPHRCHSTDLTPTLDDIPGTTVFNAEQSRKGYHLNQFCMSLMKAENRARFKADERAYLDDWAMTEDQKQAVLDARLQPLHRARAATSTSSPSSSPPTARAIQQAGGTMTGMTQEDYAADDARGRPLPRRLGAR